MFLMWKVVFVRLVSTDIDHFPLGLEPMLYTSVALVAQYLNVRQRK